MVMVVNGREEWRRRSRCSAGLRGQGERPEGFLAGVRRFRRLQSVSESRALQIKILSHPLKQTRRMLTGRLSFVSHSGLKAHQTAETV